MKTKALPFALLLISLLFLAACNTAGEAEPTASPSVMPPEQAVVGALIAYLEGQGAPVGKWM
jgi:hypothetical protein